MEASEKPQLNLDDAASDGTVRVLEDRLVIEGLTITDDRAARVVRDRAGSGIEPAATLRDAVEIGARVLEREGTAAEVDYVRRELEAGLGELNRELGETLETGSTEMAERLGAAFGAERTDSVQAQIKEIVSSGTQEQMRALVRLLTAEDGSNPLVAVQARLGKAMLEAEERHRGEVGRLRESHSKEARAMQLQVSGLREEITRLLERDAADERVAEAEDAGTRKGRTFEELVYAELDVIADARGDAAHHVGDESSESGGKKGDVVVEVDGAAGAAKARIVVEVKNKKLSKNEAWAELNGAMAERDAAFSLLVVAGDDKVPSGLHEVTEYQGNKMIVALDREDPDPGGLASAYRYARARVLMAGHGELALDAPRVREAAEQAGAALKRANRIRKALTGVKNGEKAARDELEDMVCELERCLGTIEAVVAEADDAGD